MLSKSVYILSNQQIAPAESPATGTPLSLSLIHICLDGFKNALTKVVNDYAHKLGLLKDEEKLAGEDVSEGLTAVVSVKLTEPQFEGQTKTKLGNASMRTAVERVVNDERCV